MKLNCDLGESFGAWIMPVDEQIMSYIDQANIACGFHGGDPMAMQNAISLAIQHNVVLGAHPSYPDLQGFGRRSMQMGEQELIACLHYQIAALSGMARAQGATLNYVKPHGALYNDLMKDAALRNTVMRAVASYDKDLVLMIQAHPDCQNLLAEAEQHGVTLWFEAFADRRYSDNGLLLSRSLPGAVLSSEDAVEQARILVQENCVISESGKRLALQVDTLCVHGDSPDAVAIARQVRSLLEQEQRRI